MIFFGKIPKRIKFLLRNFNYYRMGTLLCINIPQIEAVFFVANNLSFEKNSLNRFTSGLI